MTIKFTKTMYSWFCMVAMLAFGAQLQAQTSEIVIGAGSAAGTYGSSTAMFSAGVSGESGELAFPDDGTGNTFGCLALTNDLTGKIAVITRGDCAFTDKALNAQTAGAIAAIICNDRFNGMLPPSWIGDVDGAVTIPVFGLDSTTCAGIQIAMGSETVSASLNGPGIGETCITAITAVEGTNSCVMSTSGFGGTLFGGSSHATWYSYTAPMDGIMNISSCGGGADTRLIGMAADDCEGTLVPLLPPTAFWFSIDACDDGAGNIVASDFSLFVAAGETFKFLWDDAQSTDGFDFTIGTSAFPMVNGTVTVDMSNETVDATGVFVNGSITGGTPAAMTDNMDGTYSYTFAAQTNDDLSYSFYNGATQEDVAALTDCGDGTARMSTILSTVDFDIPTVCFSECGLCPVGCGDPSIIICDDFEDYDLGNIGPQSNDWATWSGIPDSPDEGAVTDAVAIGTQSLLISSADPDDAILVLGDRTEGTYTITWEQYVPAGSSAYWNVQKITSGFSNDGANFNMQTTFNSDGTGAVDVVTATAATFTYPQDDWFTVGIIFGLDSDLSSLFMENPDGDIVHVHSWAASETVSSGPGDVRIGAIDFFGNTGNLYYIDELYFEESVTGDFCYADYDIDALFHGDLDVAQTSALYNNYDHGHAEEIDPDFGWECWGEPDGGGATPSVETSMWYTFVGDGATYNIITTACTATDFIDDGDTQMALYSGTCNDLTAVACNEDYAAGGPPYPAGLDVVLEDGVVYYLMIDAFSLVGDVADGEFCVQVTKTADAPPPMYAVTFNVDLELEGTPGVGHLAGSFNGWTGEPMTLVSDNKYTLTKMLEAGTYEYKFQNDLDGWEDSITGDCTVDPDGNRQVIVADVAIDVAEVCFTYCADCQTVDVDETSLRNGISVFPNPANSFVNVNYDFSEAIDLRVNIYNSLGQLMQTKVQDNAIAGSLTLNIADLAGGVYLLEFTNGNVSASQRLIVQ